MKIWQKILNYFVKGMGFGAIIYLLIMGMISTSAMDTDFSLKSILVVFICSGLIGELSFLFQTDLSYLVALGIHLVGTFILFSIMMMFNHWTVNWQTLVIFVLAYIVIWIIIRLTQERDINRINQQIKKRSRKM